MKEIIGTFALIFFGMLISNIDRIEPWLAKKIKGLGLRMQEESVVSTGRKTT